MGIQRIYIIRCDICGISTFEFNSMKMDTIQAAKQEGWEIKIGSRYTCDNCICPDCRKERNKR